MYVTHLLLIVILVIINIVFEHLVTFGRVNGNVLRFTVLLYVVVKYVKAILCLLFICNWLVL